MQLIAFELYSSKPSHLDLRFGGGGRPRHGGGFDVEDEVHYPTRPVDKEKAEQELVVNIKKATSPEETAPKQKHVRSKYLYIIHWD